MTIRRQPHLSRRQSGFSLIEVLIALLVLALGLLGLAFLQVLNVRYTSSAENRTMATNLASEVLDMMRSNPRHVVVYQRLTQASFAGVTEPVGGCSAIGENAGSVLQNIARWRCDVVSQLPGGTGNVQIQGTQATGYIVTVTVTWVDDVGADDDEVQNARGIGQRTSFQVVSTL
ncbi:type IV pilus modification protein PilV [Lysobacter soli]|uniref:type IV pilus modification protein PilV n=1 Tax=Lysobacter soli TaxID=453783 RepID=UPI0018DE4F6B|nr:type IV pilus modification protein PilV [Lysobacter soli]